MKRLALVTALALSAGACGPNHQLTNKQVAVGVIGAAAIVGAILVLSLQCDELTMDCN
ncbi:MAG: hypothetical protein ABI867_38975 [Kofleriaceae bacterium]